MIERAWVVQQANGMYLQFLGGKWEHDLSGAWKFEFLQDVPKIICLDYGTFAHREGGAFWHGREFVAIAVNVATEEEGM